MCLDPYQILISYADSMPRSFAVNEDTLTLINKDITSEQLALACLYLRFHYRNLHVVEALPILCIKDKLSIEFTQLHNSLAHMQEHLRR